MGYHCLLKRALADWYGRVVPLRQAAWNTLMQSSATLRCGAGGLSCVNACSQSGELQTIMSNFVWAHHIAVYDSHLYSVPVMAQET